MQMGLPAKRVIKEKQTTLANLVEFAFLRAVFVCLSYGEQDEERKIKSLRTHRLLEILPATLLLTSYLLPTVPATTLILQQTVCRRRAQC